MSDGRALWVRASYTVEAACMLPLFLFAILKGLLLGIDCYHDVQAAAQSLEQLTDIEAPEWIWKMKLVEKGVNLIHEHTVSEEFEEQLYGDHGAGPAPEFGWAAGGEDDAPSEDTGTFAVVVPGAAGRYELLVSDHRAAEPVGLAGLSFPEFEAFAASPGRALVLAVGAAAILPAK
jgi:hypothetical protein